VRDRIKRLEIAILLTVLDIAAFENSCDVIWQGWPDPFWIRCALRLSLAVWIASVAVLWLHVYIDLRQPLREQRAVEVAGTADRWKEGANV